MAMKVEQRIEEINKFANYSSKRYGKLLNWQNSGDPFWHYGIGLSDKHIFDTGSGFTSFERIDAKFVINIENIAFTPKKTIGRLKHAIYVFNNWEYNLFGWNCEHLARLIATDQPRCYQSKFIWYLCDMTPEGEHKTAHKIFQNYLKEIDSTLIKL